MKKIIATAKAPKAIGPYSQGVRVGNLVFVSGQIPVEPSTGLMPDGIAAQTSLALTNLRNVLAEEGLSMDNVVKTTVFLSDMSLFAEMNAVYASFFTEGNYPVRSAVAVKELPKGAMIEVECIASVD